MPRFVVCVSEATPSDIRFANPWMGIVEADDEFSAVMQYPGYKHVFNALWFREFHEGSIDALTKRWGDTVCVRALDAMTTEFLST